MAEKTWRVSNRVVASALSIALGTAAEAAVYSAIFDPPGNGTVAGFIGEAQFTIADDCLNMGTGWFETTNANASSGCGPAFMDSAIVYLYSVVPSEYPAVPTPSNALGSFSFGPDAMEDVTGVLVIGGLLAGVDTGLMGPKQPTGEVYAGIDFWLQFDSECQFNSCFDDFIDLAALKTDADPAFIYQGSQDNKSNPAIVVFTQIQQVPEPGTLALVLGSLGLGWLMRRRQSSANT